MTKAENVETRKSEIRYRTVDTARMRNKYIARNVTRTWKENFLDKDTGKTVEIDHHQVLFEKGTLITDDVLTSIKFWQEELRYRESLKHPDRVCVRRKVKSFIEESKTIPVGRFIPVEFSQAYQDETTDVDD